MDSAGHKNGNGNSNNHLLQLVKAWRGFECAEEDPQSFAAENRDDSFLTLCLWPRGQMWARVDSLLREMRWRLWEMYGSLQHHLKHLMEDRD